MTSRTAALLTLFLSVAFVIVAPRLALSPGPQVQGHAKLENRCLDCHTIGAGVPSNKCIACHALDKIAADDAARDPRAQAIRGMHRSFGSVACGSCHSDHKGRSPSLATRAFSHDALSATLRTACADCHSSQRPTDALHREAAAPCGTCHSTTAWKPATFEHSKYFVLDRDHSVACVTCHDVANDYARYTCYGCHEHTPANMAREHREEGISTQELADCVRCHRSANEHEGGEGRGRGRGRGRD